MPDHAKDLLLEDYRYLAESLLPTYLAALVAFALSFRIQVVYINRQADRVKQEKLIIPPTHAGGVVFRRRENGVEYLLVRPTAGGTEWVLPKGHIEDSEGHGEAALREVREETGVVARLVTFVDRVQFKVNTCVVDTKFYLMESLFVSAPSEQREIQWVSLAEVAQDQSVPIESREVIQKANYTRLRKEAEQTRRERGRIDANGPHRGEPPGHAG